MTQPWMQKSTVVAVLVLLLLGSLEACHDLGTEPPSVTTPVPFIVSVKPDSVSPGDTLIISGSNFGSLPGTAAVSVGGAVADTIVLWTDTVVYIRVPAAAGNGTVTVTVNGVRSNIKRVVLLASAPLISFSNDIIPIFMDRGCYACHGGSGGLVVHTVASLLAGGSHGPAIVPYNADGSLIIQKLSPTPPFGDRMPQGGPYLPDSLIRVIKNWINEGAPDN